MRVLVIGATGSVGGAAANALSARGHEVLRASRNSELAVDITDPSSIHDMFVRTGPIDGVIVASGSVPFKPLLELDSNDYLSGFLSKTLSQIEVTRQALHYVAEGGSITLTTGALAREPIATGAAAAMANGALESYVITAAAEAARGIRINAVSPNVLASATAYHDFFPGQPQVSDDEIGRAFVLALEGIGSGQTITV